MAILVALMFVLLFSVAAIFAVNVGYQQKNLTETVVDLRAVKYYKAQAGLVDARERIRKDQLIAAWAGVDPAPRSFTNANWPGTPVSYYLHIDDANADEVSSGLQANSDVFVTITKQQANGLRTITCQSIGN